ncbi:MAG: O-antigen ligase family protein [Chloroflexota bacterium]|nr:MAG: O-antigen ligase family protein [Chloroflexota bacterium]
MDYSALSPERFIPESLLARIKSDFGLQLLLLAAGLALGLVVAYLIADDKWFVAVGLILVIPGAILLHNNPWLGLVAWLLITPYVVETTGGTLRHVYWLIHRGLPLGVVAIIILSGMLGVRRFYIPRPVWFEWVMIAYFLVSMASAFTLSELTNESAYRVYDRIGVPMLLYLIVRLQVQDEDELNRLLPVILFICLTQAMYAFLYVTVRSVLPKVWLSIDGARATGSFGSESVYGSTMLFVGAMSLHVALSNKVSGNLRLLYIGAFAASLAAVFFTFSRGSWLAGAVVVTGLAFLYPKFMVKFVAVALPIAILAGGAMFADDIAYAQQRFGTDQTVRGRLPVVLASINMFVEKPVFGWGYNNFDLYDRQFQGRVGDVASPDKDHASHNVYLTIAAEQGAVGLLLFLLPVVGLFAASLRKWPYLATDGFWSRKLLVVLWLVIAAHFIVNNFSNMRVVWGLGLYWMTLALIAVLVLPHSRSSDLSLARLANNHRS